MRKRRNFVYISIAFVLVIAFWIGWTNFNITRTRIEVENEKIPAEFDGFKIAHISDLHNYDWGVKLMDKIKKEKPDIIAITGDLVDSSKTDFDIALKFIQEAKQIAPVYYVTGNHEAWLEDYTVLKEKLEKENVNMMDDQTLFIEKANNKIQILGIQDPDFVEAGAMNYIQGEIIRSKTNELVDKTYFNILLSHRPEHFAQYVDSGADLVLTGHAHGGQFRLPFLGGLVAPNQGFFPKYTAGLYQENSTHMVVSRGLGNSIISLRLNNMPELIIIELKK